MAFIINWFDEAVKTFNEKIDYLISEWTETEIVNFIK